MASASTVEVPDMDLMRRKEVAAWELDRNNRATYHRSIGASPPKNARIKLDNGYIRN